MSYFDIVIAGILAGITSEIGGAGMLISLPMLIGLGLPPIVANGTNRIGTMMLYTFAWFEHKRHYDVDYRQITIIGIPIIIGALTGALLAVNTSQVVMQWSILVLIIAVSIFTALAKPLQPTDRTTTKPERFLDGRKIIILLGAGFYCGYMQSGMSFLMFYIIVRFLDAQRDTANGIRHFLSMAVTPISLVIFAIFGHIDWHAGFFLALGSALGGWIGAISINYLPLKLNKANIVISLAVSVIYLVYFMWKHWGSIYFI